MTEERNDRDALAPTQFHPSQFETFRYAYPAVSRRARGVSIGVNLSPTKLCNFRCVYCQVDRGERAEEIANAVRARDRDANGDVLKLAPTTTLDLELLEREATTLARSALSGALFESPRFAATPSAKRALRDFAFSGDGEPTLARQFPDAVARLVRARHELNYEPLKLVLITNATRLRAQEIVSALDMLAANNGEIWTKLDATNDAQLIELDRTRVAFATIFENIVYAARRWGVTVQTALIEWRDHAPTREQLKEYCATLLRVLDAGGRINAVQLYTVARTPVESQARSLSNGVMDESAELVRDATGLDVDVFYSK